MNRKMTLNNTLPWFKLWTGNFKSKTDHLSNAEVGAYIRLLASYWDNNGLPFNDRALIRIAKIETEDDVDLSAILGEFFNVEDNAIRHEEMDALRIEAIGEEDAKRRRTSPARAALAEQRRSVTVPVTETEVDVEVEREAEGYPEPKGDPHSDERSRKQTHTQTEDRQSDAEPDPELRQAVSHSGSQVSVQATPTRTRRSVSLKPDGGAQGGAVPTASSAEYLPFTPEQITEVDKYPKGSLERLAAIKKFSHAA